VDSKIYDAANPDAANPDPTRTSQVNSVLG
jgi:hypothetical protein